MQKCRCQDTVDQPLFSFLKGDTCCGKKFLRNSLLIDSQDSRFFKEPIVPFTTPLFETPPLTTPLCIQPFAQVSTPIKESLAPQLSISDLTEDKEWMDNLSDLYNEMAGGYGWFPASFNEKCRKRNTCCGCNNRTGFYENGQYVNAVCEDGGRNKKEEDAQLQSLLPKGFTDPPPIPNSNVTPKKKQKKEKPRKDSRTKRRSSKSGKASRKNKTKLEKTKLKKDKGDQDGIIDDKNALIKSDKDLKKDDQDDIGKISPDKDINKGCREKYFVTRCRDIEPSKRCHDRDIGRYTVKDCRNKDIGRSKCKCSQDTYNRQVNRDPCANINNFTGGNCLENLRFHFERETVEEKKSTRHKDDRKCI